MRRVLASLRLKPDPLHQPFVSGRELHQSLLRRECGKCRGRLGPAEGFEIVHPQFERLPAHPAQHGRDLVRDNVIDVADKAQRHVIVLGVDPARAREPATQQGQRLANIERNFETGEEARHENNGSPACAYMTTRGDSHASRGAYMTRLSRARPTSSSTLGRMRATIASMPAAVGGRAARWLSPASPAPPAGKDG